MNQEIELKLDVSPDDRRRIGESRLMPAKAETQDLHATYFDTPDHALRGAGISLRIRQKGEDRIQTVKILDGAAGLLSRAEWERPVQGRTPELAEVKPVRKALNGRVDEIAPAFNVEVNRRTWLLERESAWIEVALDHGWATAETRETAIDEIELELKDGPPGALFTLARKIDSVAPVRLSVQSKSDRGYRLLGPAKTAFKAEPTPLRPDQSLVDAFRTIAHGCIRQYRLNEALLLDRMPSLEQAGPDAVHQARVAIRRLRSAFKAFGKRLRGPEVEAFKRELKWLAHKLGDARDLDVLLEKAEAGELRQRLEAARTAAYVRLGRALAAKRSRYLMLDLAEWLMLGDFARARGWKRRPTAFAAKTLERHHDRIRKIGHDLAALDDTHRHEVRKQAKALRYMAEFFSGLFDDEEERKARKRFFAAMETLQDELGALNDLVTGPDLLKRLRLATLEGADRLAGHGDKAKLREKAEDAFAQFLKAEKFWRA